MTRTVPTVLAAVVLTAAATAMPPRLTPAPADTLRSAIGVLDDLAEIPAKGIPPSLLADAHGVAVIPRVVKAGFIVAGRGGHGVVVARGRTGSWGDPVFVNLGGAGVGFQAGIESTDVVLVFRDRRSLDRLLAGKGKVTLGADAAVAAGPLGREAMAGTDARMEAEILSYSRSRGLFAGVSLSGAVIRPDANSNAMFRADTRPEAAQQVAALKAALDALARPQRTPPILMPPVAVPAPPAVRP
jgi:lipid-binding SYLF domain-containing protein